MSNFHLLDGFYNLVSDLRRRISRNKSSCDMRKIAMEVSGGYVSPYQLLHVHTGLEVESSLLKSRLRRYLTASNDQIHKAVVLFSCSSEYAPLHFENIVSLKEKVFNQRRAAEQGGRGALVSKTLSQRDLIKLRRQYLEREPALRYRYASLIFFRADGRPRLSRESIIAARDLVIASTRKKRPVRRKVQKYRQNTTFSGSSQDALSILKVLSMNSRSHCPYILQQLGFKGGDSWSQVALVWMNGELNIPGEKGVNSLAAGVRKCRKRFLVAPLVLVSENKNSLHANMLIFDIHMNAIEWYEPYGRFPKGYGQKFELEKCLQRLSKSVYNVNSSILVEATVSSGLGLQARQEMESIIGSKSRSPGFCLAWSGLYASVRLESPMDSVHTISEKLLQLIRDDASRPTLTQYIEEFADAVVL